MREILFRGKRLDNGEWIEGYYVKTVDYRTDSAVHLIIELPSAFYPRGEIAREYEINSSTIGQSTGLTDKNGRKIFEGDILAAPDYPYLKYKVSFLNANFCVKCPALPYLFYLGSRCFDMFGNPEYEIVGNIHDNPELLEVTE